MTAGSRIDLKSFSDFVSEVNARAVETDAEGIARWAIDHLSQTLGFDGAWYGWAQIEKTGVQIHANASLNLPDDYYDFWQTMADDDLLAARLIREPGAIATYERYSGQQNDGMITLSDRYGLTRMATVMNRREGRLASFYLSSYRMGRVSREFSPAEQEYLQCAVDQLGRAMKLSSFEYNRRAERGTISILVNESGIGILGLANLREQLGEFWPGWKGDLLPEKLTRLIHIQGKHVLHQEQMIVICENAPQYQGMRLRRLTLRRMMPMDHLTLRESEVAELLAKGRSHKDVARMLGIAPSTVRNQTQSIYDKLGVNSRAELASMFAGAKAGPVRPASPPAP
ncbi:MAG: LuxR C-terminal-related transcriptional regulator [Hoeflea sp.]|uniref:response regulator transcription factor n=1 Tax=Hoeflea sp. TaxID=1940281 RepID=UPI0027311CE4|nr:LuxR C-terminal-related transcriptional regulator [Hoeflea sp.]MDP2122712.1 LuxR C-terminal-related transcriptional regulator [Hoeflea sp.]